MHDKLIYYGKLPAFGDFVRYNASGPEIKLFDQWIQEALYFNRKRLHPEIEKAFEISPAYCFFLSFKDSENYLTGLMKPSRDKVGRRYPFIVAKLINDSDIYPDPEIFLPVQFKTFYKYTYSFIEKLNTVKTPDELRQQTIRFAPEISHDEEAYRQYHSILQTTSTKEFFPKLWNADAGNKKHIFLKNVVSMGEYLRERDPGIIDFGFRFPLQSESYDAFIVGSYWLQLLGLFINNRTVFPFIFWDTTNMFLFLRQPPPVVYSCMIKTDLRSDVVYIMDSDGEQGYNEQNISPQIFNMLNTDTITLDRFLQMV